MAYLATLTDNQQAFQNWLLLSEEEREADGLPTTYEGFAKLIRVDRKTLYNWKEIPGFRQAVFKETWYKHLIDKFPDILRAAAQRATTPKGSRDFATIMRTLEPYLPFLLQLDQQPDQQRKLIERAQDKLNPEELEQLLELSDKMQQLLAKIG